MNRDAHTEGAICNYSVSPNLAKQIDWFWLWKRFGYIDWKDIEWKTAEGLLLMNELWEKEVHGEENK